MPLLWFSKPALLLSNNWARDFLSLPSPSSVSATLCASVREPYMCASHWRVAKKPTMKPMKTIWNLSVPDRLPHATRLTLLLPLIALALNLNAIAQPQESKPDNTAPALEESDTDTNAPAADSPRHQKHRHGTHHSALVVIGKNAELK